MAVERGDELVRDFVSDGIASAAPPQDDNTLEDVLTPGAALAPSLDWASVISLKPVAYPWHELGTVVLQSLLYARGCGRDVSR